MILYSGRIESIEEDVYVVSTPYSQFAAVIFEDGSVMKNVRYDLIKFDGNHIVIPDSFFPGESDMERFHKRKFVPN